MTPCDIAESPQIRLPREGLDGGKTAWKERVARALRSALCIPKIYTVGDLVAVAGCGRDERCTRDWLASWLLLE